MPIIEIHGKEVHIPEGSQSAKYAAEYLKGLDKGEAHNFFRTAEEKKYSHFETPRHENIKDLHHNMTLEHRSGGGFELRKRTEH